MSPLSLMMVNNPQWHRASHLKLLNDELLEIFDGDNDRLMVFLPPGHGKSSLISETFPSWWLGHHPDDRIIFVSYEHNFAAGKGRACRDLFAEWGPKSFNHDLRPELQRADEWGIKDHRGIMWSAGVGGAITGKRANLIIIDDPVKNAEQADSPTYRRRAYDWYKTTLRTRLEPGGAIILVMTRWHEADLAGRLLEDQETGGDEWKVINLPAIAEEEDALGRSPGQALWPERFPIDALEQTRRDNPPRWWNALYQQRPSPEEGNIVNRNWWQYHRPVHPDDVQMDDIIQSWDCSFKETGNSYVVGQVWGIKGPNKYLLDQFRERTDFPGTLRAIRQMTDKWPQARTKLIEDAANGPAVIATLKREISGIIPVRAAGSKEARLHAVVPEIEAGNVYLPEGAPWVRDFIEEFVSFPNGANDDQVDAATQALTRLTEGRRRIRSISKTALGL